MIAISNEKLKPLAGVETERAQLLVSSDLRQGIVKVSIYTPLYRIGADNTRLVP
jgi:hypothetical protein